MYVLTKMKKKQSKSKDPFKEILDILDEYYEDTPPRSSKYPEGGE